MKRILLLLFVILIPSVNADNYEIVGDAVQLKENSDLSLSITPHTVTDPEPNGFYKQELSLILKQFSGSVRIGFGFDSENAIPKSLDVYRNEDWESISSNFNKINYNFEGYDTWYTADFVLSSGTEYLTRMYLDIPIKIGERSGKYYIAIWPSSYGNDIQAAIVNGHFYYIDPWFEPTTYGFRYEIISNATVTTVPIAIEDNNTVNSLTLWTLNSTSPERRFIYSTTSGPTGGSQILANETAEVDWERSNNPQHATIGNNPETVFESSGVVMWQHLDQAVNINDSTTNDHTGIQQGGGGTLGTTGKINDAIEFDGAAEYYTIADSTDLRFDAGTLDFSVCVWVNADSGEDAGVIADKRDGTSDGWHFNIGGGGAAFGRVNGIAVQGTGDVSDGTWHHVCMAIDRSGNGIVYTDAVPGATSAIGGEVMATTSDVYVGRRSYGAAEYLDGIVDELSIWNKTLSLAEIQTMYWNGIDNLTELSAEQGGAAPTITLNSPVDGITTSNSTIIVNATGTDPEDDDLTFYLIWNGTVVDSNSNGSFNYTHNDVEGLQNWTVNVSDGPNNVSTSIRTITIGYTNLILYNLTSNTLITSNMTVRVRNDNFSIILTTSGNNVTLRNLDSYVGDKLILQATNSSSPYFDVQILDESYTAGDDYAMYLVSTADDYALNTLKLQDLVGTFTNADFEAWAYVGGSFVQCVGDIFDIEDKIVAYFDRDTRYTIYVRNPTQTRIVGGYVPDVTGSTKIVTIGSVDFGPNLVKMSDNVTYEWNQTATSITFSWVDIGNTTTSVNVTIFNRTNWSQQVYNAICTNSSTCSFTFVVPNLNISYTGFFQAQTGWGHSPYEGSKGFWFLFGAGTYKINLGLPAGKTNWYPAIAVSLVIISAMLFRRQHAALNGIASMSVAIFCTMIGWLPQSYLGMLAVLMVMAMVHAVRKREGVK